MKAIVQDSYGPPDVLRIESVAEPQIGAHEILVVDPRRGGATQVLWGLNAGTREDDRTGTAAPHEPCTLRSGTSVTTRGLPFKPPMRSNSISAACRAISSNG